MNTPTQTSFSFSVAPEGKVANPPKIDSEGLRQAAREGHKRVSSVASVSRSICSRCGHPVRLKLRGDADDEPLLYWVKERESMRLKKESGMAPPWSPDPILNTYRWTNVRRKDDRVTRWILQNVLAEYRGMDYAVFLQWSALARWINWPPTLATIMADEMVTRDYIDIKGIGALLDAKLRPKVWTGAYMVRAPKTALGMGKGRFVAEVVIGAGMKEGFAVDMVGKGWHPSVARVWKSLVDIPNWGSFMAGQVVADWAYTPLLKDAHDLTSWAPQGPGSKRGYNRLTHRPLEASIKESDWLDQLQNWREKIVNMLGPNHKDMPLSDVQNCLCEVSKYLRVKEGGSPPRSLYKPETAY